MVVYPMQPLGTRNLKNALGIFRSIFTLHYYFFTSQMFKQSSHISFTLRFYWINTPSTECEIGVVLNVSFKDSL